MYLPVMCKSVLRVGLLVVSILALVLLLASCGGLGSAKGEKAGVQSAGEVTQTLRTREGNQFIEVGAGSVWMPNYARGTITRVDPKKSKVEALIEVNSDVQSAPYETDPQSVATSGEQIWFTDRAKEAVSRIDPNTNRIVERIPVGIVPYDIAVDGDTLWVTDLGSDVVVRVDASTNRVVKRIEVPGPAGIVVGASSVWVVEFGGFINKPSKLARIDPQTNEVVKEIPIVTYTPQYIAYGAGSVWIVGGNSYTGLLRVDPKTNEVVRVKTGQNMYGVAFGGGSVWATGSPEGCKSSKEGTLMRIDPTTNEVVGRTDKIKCAYGVALTNDAVWISSDVGPLRRVEPTR